MVLLFAATVFAPPFESARASITPDILSGERYTLGTAVIQTTYLTAEVAGAAGGGVAVAFLGVRPALVIDAATFVASGLLIAVAGGIGTVAAFALTLSWRRVSPSGAGHEAGRRPVRALARVSGLRGARRGHDQAIRTCGYLTGPSG